MQTMKIGNKVIQIPIVQGGMGVGVSLSSLASAVINEGGIGTISASQIGFREPKFFTSSKRAYEANLQALKKEIEIVRKNTSSSGFLAVNILTASRQYAELARTCVENKVDAIVSGAGLPLDLPKYTKGTDTCAIPIVANSRVLSIIIKKWQRKYDTLPDAVVVEGPMAGGHLGVKYEEIGKKTTDTLESRLEDVLNFKNKFNYEFPIIVAGGVFSADDVKKFIDLGADAVQLGTRFIGTKECDASKNFKNKFLAAEKDDIVYVKSPVGYPARAIRNEFTELIEKGNIMPKVCINCVLPCNGRDENTPYCISKYLVDSVEGDSENGLIFSGENGYRLEKILSVKELIQELISKI